MTAFKAASAGDTLKLVGTFGVTRLQDRSFAKVVTLDLSKAVFNDSLALARIDNLKVIGGKWDLTGGSVYGRAAVAYGGSNIWFDRTTVVGVAGQQGINFVGTSNAQVSNGSFTGLQVAIGLTSLTGGLATRNKILHAVADGIDIADSHFVTASSNACAASNPGPGAHPDCIQLWSTAGHAVQSDIIVTKNSASGMTQGFTSFSDGGGALRVQFTRNTVTTSLPQGIACYDCFDSTISYNKVSTIAGSAHQTRVNIVGGDRNIVANNVVGAFTRSAAMSSFEEGAVSTPGYEAPDLGRFAAGASPATVPEPGTWALLIAGFGLVGFTGRRARAAA